MRFSCFSCVYCTKRRTWFDFCVQKSICAPSLDRLQCALVSTKLSDFVESSMRLRLIFIISALLCLPSTPQPIPFVRRLEVNKSCCWMSYNDSSFGGQRESLTLYSLSLSLLVEIAVTQSGGTLSSAPLALSSTVQCTLCSSYQGRGQLVRLPFFLSRLIYHFSLR